MVRVRVGLVYLGVAGASPALAGARVGAEDRLTVAFDGSILRLFK